MIANQVIGRSFKGALAYVFGKAGSEPLASNLAVDADDGINRMAAEFLAVCAQRPNLSRNVAHIQLSANPGDNLDAAQWQAFMRRWMQEMGYGNCLYAAARHSDTANDHVHIVISRVDLDGKTVSDNNNYAKNLKVTRALEAEFGLVPTITSNKPKPTPKWQRDKALPVDDYIKQAIITVAASAPNMPDFIKGLQAVGIRPEIKFSSGKGLAQGISFKYESYSVKGSVVGYSLNKIINELGVEYKDEHRERIKRIQAQHSGNVGSESRPDAAAEQPAATANPAGVGDRAAAGPAAASPSRAADGLLSPGISASNAGNQGYDEQLERGFSTLRRSISGFIEKCSRAIGTIRQSSRNRKAIGIIREGTAGNKRDVESIVAFFENPSPESIELRKRIAREARATRPKNNSSSFHL